jgi:hypothetical protein
MAMPPRSSPLTLRGVLGAVAGLALAFATLPVGLSMPLAVAVSGILALQGMRLPVITEGGGARRWLPWAAWSLMLAVCPVAIAVVGELFPRVGPPVFTGPRPWAARVVDSLVSSHIAASVVAAMAVVVLTRGGYRWLAWAAIVLVAPITGLFALGAAMATTGVYL